MRALTAVELLDAWERGSSQPRSLRALELLAAASGEPSVDALTSISVGERDARLLTLREHTFGPTLVSVADCERCGEPAEWTFTTSDVRVASIDRSGEDLSIEIGECRVRFRVPTCADLGLLAECRNVEEGKRTLLGACVLAADRQGTPLETTDLPETLVAAVVQRLAEIDPQADVHAAVMCPACGHQWDVLLDVEAFVWTEVTAWAQRALRDVHTLASAYGWRETDILNLSAWRRQVYLAQVDG